ncbi:aminopeptidase [Actinoplanes sp. SE50]|uniref:aminopeptidase n=1 Tax=unclassified Actinoplanes TaxID=2626549 RepID=UPI00023EBFCB|nr:MULTISPECIES: aminopeptidase [unclassified Actinoplanes]AEV87487.1 aminopeptidase [Actinoplanes sp. SE50/110]ATO85889.1 aminopeptidase [Actinoplanes sp. SE50]SLM03303.1 aminopeptidase [Actinoplanes sp. SE50/110]
MDWIPRFAEVVVRAGVNIQPGQGVVLNTDTAHLEVARAVVEAAYAAGAAWVEPVWSDGPMRRSAVDHSDLADLTSSRPWALQRIREWADQGAAWITLIGDADPHLLDGADPAKAAAIRTGEMVARRDAMIGKLRWTAVGAPNPGWATQVYGEPDLERLWQAVGIAMRLDEDDPVQAWRQRSATLAERGTALDALGLTEVRYVGEGTDLTVGLIPGCHWTGGGMIDDAGIPYLANIPTEEVFTSPDRRRADGTLRVTKPVAIGGRVVTGLRLTFAGGRITAVTADEGADVVRAQLETDPGARHLGEVSLVDKESRIARTGTLFHNMLFDENAACHVAWGQSFPFAVPGGVAMTPEQRAELGLNSSGVHTDVVVGGAGITVTGTGPRGTVEIIRDDEWVLV